MIGLGKELLELLQGLVGFLGGGSGLDGGAVGLDGVDGEDAGLVAVHLHDLHMDGVGEIGPDIGGVLTGDAADHDVALGALGGLDPAVGVGLQMLVGGLEAHGGGLHQHDDLALAAHLRPLGLQRAAGVAGIDGRPLHVAADRALAAQDLALLQSFVIGFYQLFQFDSHVRFPLSQSFVRMMTEQTFWPPPKPRSMTVFGVFLTW